MVERITARAGLWAALVGALLGCGDSVHGDPARPTADEFAEAAAIGECSDYRACCAADGFPFDERRCRSNVASAVRMIAASEAVLYDAAAAGACVAAMRANPGQCESNADEFAACVPVFRGTKPVGAPCTLYQECDGFGSSAYCTANAEGTDVCTALPGPEPHAGAGESCGLTCRIGDAVSTYACSGVFDAAGTCFTNDGLFCSSASMTCEPLIPGGEACGVNDLLSCTAGAFCDGGRCSPSRGEGESCADDRACHGGTPCSLPNPFACDPTLVCIRSGETFDCGAPQPDGAACSSFEECASRWCELDCSGSTCAATGVCAQPKRTSPEFCSGDSSSAASAASQSVAGPRASWWMRPQG